MPALPRHTARVAVRRSRIDGHGLFVTVPIAPRRKIGEITGIVVARAEGHRRHRRQKRIKLIELNDRESLDLTRGGNEFQYLNHSCTPNTFVRIIGRRVEVYALRSIRRHEELTCDYGETQHEGRLPCKCGSQNCRGAL